VDFGGGQGRGYRGVTPAGLRCDLQVMDWAEVVLVELEVDFSHVETTIFGLISLIRLYDMLEVARCRRAEREII
jgi:hypothetical protein